MEFNIVPGSPTDRLIDQWVDFTLTESDAWRPRPPREMLDPENLAQMTAFGARLCMRTMEPEIDPGAVNRDEQPQWYGGRKDN